MSACARLWLGVMDQLLEANDRSLDKHDRTPLGTAAEVETEPRGVDERRDVLRRQAAQNCELSPTLEQQSLGHL